jgi:hypothetical protein
MLVHAGSPRALGVHGFSGETLEKQLSYLRSLQRHAAMEYGEVRSVVALKPGVGDHAPERFADHELGSCYRGLGQIRRRAAIDPWLERIYRTTLFDS